MQTDILDLVSYPTNLHVVLRGADITHESMGPPVTVGGPLCHAASEKCDCPQQVRAAEYAVAIKEEEGDAAPGGPKTARAKAKGKKQ